jgi:hypothetical protein
MNTGVNGNTNLVENTVNMMNTVNEAMNSAMNTAINSATNSPIVANTLVALNNSVGNTGSMWFWVSIVSLLAIIIAIALWKLGYLSSTSSVFPVSTSTLPPPIPESAVQKEETWCFVGEDMTGRWCVRVPHRGACDPERAYSRQSDCELTNASRLPLGTNMEGGARVAPFMGPPPSSQPIG